MPPITLRAKASNRSVKVARPNEEALCTLDPEGLWRKAGSYTERPGGTTLVNVLRPAMRRCLSALVWSHQAGKNGGPKAECSPTHRNHVCMCRQTCSDGVRRGVVK